MEDIDKVFGNPTFYVGSVENGEKSHPIVFGKCDKPVFESDKEPYDFKNTWSGEITFTVPGSQKLRPIKGNRRQRKAAAFANNKTIFGLMEKYTARSKKLDRKREKREQKEWRRFVRRHQALFNRLRQIDQEMIATSARLRAFENYNIEDAKPILYGRDNGNA